MRFLVILGGLWGASTAPALLWLPIIPFCQSTITTAGQEQTSCSAQSLIQIQGGQLEPITWLFLALMTGLSIGAFITGWGARVGSRRSGALLLIMVLILIVGILIASLSIGLYYVPAVVLLIPAGMKWLFNDSGR